MPDWRILQQDTSDPNAYRVIDRRIAGVDAGDAYRKAIAAGKIPVTATNARYEVVPLDGAKTFALDLSIRDLG